MARTRRYALLLLTVLLAAGTVVGAGHPAHAAPATLVSERWLDSRTVDLTVRSPANNRALPVRVIVPAGWSRTATRTWPVLYLLHGGNDDYTSWTRETDIEQLSANVQALIVMPEAGRDATYVDWFRPDGGPNAGLWETFHLTELWQLLRADYRAGETRGVAGISSGGTGAMSYAGRHPGMFRAAAAYSAPLNLFDPLLRTALLRTAEENGDDPMAMWGSPILQAANWRAHNPLDLAPNLGGTSLYLSSGTTGLPGDLDPNGSWSPVQFGEIPVGASTSAMAWRLSAARIPVTVNKYLNGTHSWPYWQRELHASWPQLMGALGVAAG
jgi:diacylglycerol O-acyltransferase/trehalose O-mycolyltransferase